MNMKKLVLIGAVALVVLGSVIAAGCTSTPTTQQTTGKDNALSLPVGEWICKNFAAEDGRIITAVQTIKADGTGYWMELNDSNPGFQLVRAYTSTFSKPDQNGAFEKVSSSGKNCKMVYDAAKGTITQDGRNVYTKIDPLVGIWYGPASSGNGGKTSTLFKPDGTGVVTVSYGDLGTAKLYTATWKKNADGTYAANFSSGENRIYTLDPSGLTVSSSGGSVKHKAFLNTSFLVSVVGPWYNKDKNALAVFSADGTGFVKSQRIFPFTWKLTDVGKFAVTYTDGTADDGSSLKDKTFEWTYDRDNNVFSSSTGTKYIHPTGDIEGKISFN